ncbi:hypothetical protein T492DRAFT_1096407 [Pavlovales sp. CCMP2436]|nr:hypothetical protein T492DRAFT_1096407 [Pavlovales sp. CCMP2436]
MTALTEMALSANALTGTIPSELCGMTALNKLCARCSHARSGARCQCHWRRPFHACTALPVRRPPPCSPSLPSTSPTIPRSQVPFRYGRVRGCATCLPRFRTSELVSGLESNRVKYRERYQSAY